MDDHEAETEQLLQRASAGDPAAREALLMRYRQRLRQMIAVRMDRRLAARIDPSDVVQEALTEASQKLPAYLAQRPLPLYPWLRQLAWERLIEVHRRHVYAQKRSVLREDQFSVSLPDESALQLAGRLFAPGSSPSKRLIRAEVLLHVRTALEQLNPRDREVLVMRHLEQMTMAEIAAVQGATEGAI